jgi:hypothetical protein
MIGAGLWRAKGQKVEKVHQWRARRSCRGELVQWDTSEHDWLEGRGEKLYLIHMIDDATSELTARFVRHDSTEENMRLLRAYLERQGRPVAECKRAAAGRARATAADADRTGLAGTGNHLDRGAFAPSQGRVERSFGTAQDRLVKGLRVAGARTLEEANGYLENEYLPWWNQHLGVAPANPADATGCWNRGTI